MRFVWILDLLGWIHIASGIAGMCLTSDLRRGGGGGGGSSSSSSSSSRGTRVSFARLPNPRGAPKATRVVSTSTYLGLSSCFPDDSRAATLSSKVLVAGPPPFGMKEPRGVMNMLDRMPQWQPLLELVNENSQHSRQYCADQDCVDAALSLKRMKKRKQAAADRVKRLVRQLAQDLMLNSIERKSATCLPTFSAEPEQRLGGTEVGSSMSHLELAPGDSAPNLHQIYVSHLQPLECVASLLSTDKKLEKCDSVLDELLDELLHAIWAPS